MNRLSRFSFLILASLHLVACGGSTDRWAVVLWPETGSPIPPAEVFAVETESESQGLVGLSVDGEVELLSAWRATLFDSQAAAQEFLESYNEWEEVWARSLRTALPVRERPDRASARVYRLRDGEIMKVIDRLDEQSDEAGLVGYWYRVLTEEGVDGWVFGFHLELTAGSGRALEPRDDRDAVDRLVRDIAEQVWRPLYFEEMVEDSRINLFEFDPRFGLFGSFEDRTFRIRLPDFDRTFEYTGYTAVSRDRIEFEGSELALETFGGGRVVAEYRVNDRPRTTTFVLFEESVEELVAFERQRRTALFDQLTRRGTEVASTAYGRITFASRTTVTWEGYERLVPQVLPAAFDGTASIDFPYFLGEELIGRYDGVMRLVIGGGRSVAFLYSVTEEGLRLVYLPDGLINDQLIVEEEPLSPLVLFYRYLPG